MFIERCLPTNVKKEAAHDFPTTLPPFNDFNPTRSLDTRMAVWHSGLVWDPLG